MWRSIDLSVYTHPLTGKQDHAQNSTEEMKVDGHRCIWIRIWINSLKCNLLAIRRPTIINYFWTTNITWDCPGQTRTCGHFLLRPAHIGVFGSESMKTKLHIWGGEDTIMRKINIGSITSKKGYKQWLKVSQGPEIQGWAMSFLSPKYHTPS